ncbi:MAG: asparagine synthase-related protein, partial [Pseudomonadota bacterium]
GVFPLVWAQAGEGLVFGASVGAVRAHPAVKAELDPQAIFDYLYFHAVPAPSTAYRGISRLRSAERLLWRKGRAQVDRYWQPEFTAAGQRVDERGLGEALRTQLGAAVADAADGGERVACFLSGGLDSSSVTGLAASRLAQAKGRAYTMGFAAEGFDEMEYARLAARHFSVELRERYISPDEVAEAMPVVAAWYDEPFGNSSAVPAYVCAKTAAEEGVTRMLAGDGGDELFAGNARYVRQQLFHYYDRLPSPAKTLLQRALLMGDDSASPLAKVPGLSKLVSYVAQARPGMPARYDSYNFVLRYGADRLLSDEWLAQVRVDHPLALQEETWSSAPTDDLLQQMLFLDWQFTLADNDLRKVGGMCAAAGVQVSYPMLDDRVLDVSLAVPPELMIKRHRLRHFFKSSMDDFLPKEIINKPKHGFGLPFGIWLKESAKLREVVYDALDRARARGIVRPAFIDDMVREHREGHAYYFGGMLWIIVMLELWLDSH